MKIKILAVGPTQSPHIRLLTNDYIKRLTGMVRAEMIELDDIKNTQNMPEETRKIKEGEKILKHLKPRDYVVLLDERGKMYSSTDWARHLQNKMNHLQGDLVFVIGGPYGFSDEVYRRAQEKLSLSPMTFSHQLVRLIFAEQLYRAFSIMHGKPYHHA